MYAYLILIRLVVIEIVPYACLTLFHWRCHWYFSSEISF